MFLSHKPTIAVIPFSARVADREQHVLGEVLADELIAILSRSRDLQLISRLSRTRFRDYNITPAEIPLHLRVNYVLTGEYDVSGDAILLSPRMDDVASGEVVWQGDTLKGNVNDLLRGDDELIVRLVAAFREKMEKHAAELGRREPLPRLQNHVLLMGAIALMHSASARDFEHAGAMLKTLTDRSSGHALPHAWLGMWHVLRINRGHSTDRRTEVQLALDCAKRALDAEPDCPLALTIDGLVHTYLLKEPDVGLARYELALSIKPNESLALLLRGTLHAFRGEGARAVEDTERALALSPLGPLRGYYESLAATAAHSAGLHERAVELAQRSLRSNRTLPTTLRALAIAQVQLGRMVEAQRIVRDLLKLTPDLTVGKYLEENPSSLYGTGIAWADALRRAGVPEE